MANEQTDQFMVGGYGRYISSTRAAASIETLNLNTDVPVIAVAPYPSNMNTEELADGYK